jgi:hypothetical protein
MCAHQPKRFWQRDDDEERRDRVDAAKQDESLNDEQVMRLARKHLPWKDWLVNEYLIYWYWLAALAGDLFLLLDMAQRYHVRDARGIVILLVALGVLIWLEYRLFGTIWPEGKKSRPKEEF